MPYGSALCDRVWYNTIYIETCALLQTFVYKVITNVIILYKQCHFFVSTIIQFCSVNFVNDYDFTSPTKLERSLLMALVVRCFVCHTFYDPANLQTNWWSDWTQNRQVTSLWNSPDPTNFRLCPFQSQPFPGLWFVDGFLCIWNHSAKLC